MKKIIAVLLVTLFSFSVVYGWGELSANYWKRAKKAETEALDTTNGLSDEDRSAKFEEAAKYFKKVVKSSPEFVSAYYSLANMEYRVDDVDGAIEWYVKSLAQTPTTYAYLQIGTSYLRKSSASQIDAQKKEFKSQAKKYFDKGLKTEESDMEKEESVKKNQASIYYNLYIIYFEEEDWSQAENAALNAMVHPDFEETMSTQLIQIYQRTKRFDEALKTISKKLKKDSKNMNLIKLKINVLSTMGEKKLVLKEMAKLEKMGGEDAQVLTWLGQDALDNGEYEKAKGLFDKVIEKDDTNAIGYLGAGKALFKMGKKQAAMEQFKIAEQYGGSDYLVLVNIGDAYMDLQKYSQAINYYARVEMLKKADISVLHNLGKCYMSKKTPNFQKAIQYFKKALSLDGSFLPSMMGITVAYYSNKDHKKAYYWAKKVLKRKNDKYIAEIVSNIEKSGVLNK